MKSSELGQFFFNWSDSRCSATTRLLAAMSRSVRSTTRALAISKSRNACSSEQPDHFPGTWRRARRFPPKLFAQTSSRLNHRDERAW